MNSTSTTAVKRHASHLLAELGVDQLSDLDPTAMTADQRSATAAKLFATAQNIIKKVEPNTTEERAQSLETAFDALLEAAELFRADQRDNRRPRGENVATNGSGEAEPTEERSDILAPEQRMVTWAAAQGAPRPGVSLGGYLRSMVLGASTEPERRALAEGTDSAGGFTVPTVLSAELIDRLRAASVITQAGARFVPLTSDDNSIAKLATDPSPAWREENAAVNESDPTFTRVQLVPRSLAVMVKVSRELLEDSVNIGTALPNALAAAMALELDRVALLGTGTAPEPRGVVNTSGIGSNALNAALTGFAPLMTARTAILTANAGPVSAIILHPRDEGKLVGLTDGEGQPLNMPRALEQIPMLTTTAIPVNGGTGTNESTIIAGNFAHLLVGIRSQVRIELLKERYADNMQYAFLAHMRADVALAHAGAFHKTTGVKP